MGSGSRWSSLRVRRTPGAMKRAPVSWSNTGPARRCGKVQGLHGRGYARYSGKDALESVALPTDITFENALLAIANLSFFSAHETPVRYGARVGERIARMGDLLLTQTSYL